MIFPSQRVMQISAAHAQKTRLGIVFFTPRTLFVIFVNFIFYFIWVGLNLFLATSWCLWGRGGETSLATSAGRWAAAKKLARDSSSPSSPSHLCYVGFNHGRHSPWRQASEMRVKRKSVRGFCLRTGGNRGPSPKMKPAKIANSCNIPALPGSTFATLQRCNANAVAPKDNDSELRYSQVDPKSIPNPSPHWILHLPYAICID